MIRLQTAQRVAMTLPVPAPSLADPCGTASPVESWTVMLPASFVRILLVPFPKDGAAWHRKNEEARRASRKLCRMKLLTAIDQRPDSYGCMCY